MIWHICFISLANLFEIQIFSSYNNYSFNYEYLSWTDDTHNQLFSESNTTELLIDKCDRKLEYLIARCLLINNDDQQQYECHSVEQSNSQKRFKRADSQKHKRSSYVVLSLSVGISCFLIGIILGTIITMIISIKRQKRLEQQADATNQPNNLSNILNQNKGLIISPTFNPISDHIPIHREREMSDNPTMILNRYQPLNDSPLKQDRTIQRTPISNFAYHRTTLPHDNLLPINLTKAKFPSKNINSNVKTYHMGIKRAKSR